jgi:hypothetical protein
LLFRNFAAPSTASFEPLNRFGTIGLSTSAMTATWISVAVIPTSVALGASFPLVCAPADTAVAESVLTATVRTAPSANQRTRFMFSPAASAVPSTGWTRI